MTEIALPSGHHYAVTWDIPDKYAGMTNSMLHRSRAFVELAGTDVTILTYAHRDDFDVVRQRLRDRGAMIDGMHIANVWEDLRSWDDDRSRHRNDVHQRRRLGVPPPRRARRPLQRVEARPPRRQRRDRADRLLPCRRDAARL